SRVWPGTARIGSNIQNTQIKTEVKFVRITHPVHPLRGQAVRVLEPESRSQPDQIRVQRPDGTSQLMPLDWTDQTPQLACLAGARLVLANLLVLSQCVAGLLAEPQPGSIMPPDSNISLTGGTKDEASQTPAGVAETLNGPAGPSDGDAGPAGAPAPEPRKEAD
ncbi:MAG: Y4bD/Y4pK family protein, partial [Anaerolineae bacterium]|nr:Y4bD/Y4pK family protein [Anaerolineae bacterium]